MMYKIIDLANAAFEDDTGDYCYAYMQKDCFEAVGAFSTGQDEVKERLVGCAIYSPFDGNLAFLCVDQAYRRQGVGSALVRHCQERVCETEFELEFDSDSDGESDSESESNGESNGEIMKEVYVHTFEWRREVRSFYESLGFKAECEIPDYYKEKGNGIAVVYIWSQTKPSYPL